MKTPEPELFRSGRQFAGYCLVSTKTIVDHLFCLIRHPLIIAPIAPQRQALLTERLQSSGIGGGLACSRGSRVVSIQRREWDAGSSLFDASATGR
jgi:hypothetical protein